MNFNIKNMDKKLNDLMPKFKSMQNDEKLAVGGIILGILLIIISLLFM